MLDVENKNLNPHKVTRIFHIPSTLVDKPKPRLLEARL